MTTPEGPGPESLPAAGWYADPTAPPGRTGRRYWDGAAWTEHVVADPLVVGRVKDDTTPDGQPLARWGRRLGAYVIDGAVMWTLTIVLTIPLLRSMIDSYVDFFERSVDAGRAGARPPGQLDIYAQIYPQLIAYTVIALAVAVVYQSVFLRVWSATPGKLAVGVRVRLRETPGPLPWSAIARRVFLTWVVGIGLGAVPLVGSAAGLYLWIDGLWPLWDDKRQALHDRFARTSVVRVRG